MVLSDLWEFSQAEEGKGCGEKQQEVFLNLEWQGVSLQWSYCPSCHWGESLSKEQPCEQVWRSAEVSVVRILRPEWMFSLTKIRKWALLKLSWVPLEPRDQPLCGNYLLHNTHDLMQFSQQLWREISHPLTLFDGEGTGTPLQYSCLENPMGRGAWYVAVHGVAKSRTRLSDFTFTFHFHALEKEMATHSSVLAWRIPGTGESAGLPSIGRIESDTTEVT